ncbi:MAG TPA: cyclic nucleotide-binding domain-containing protein [Actinomycetota bacterium]
MPAAIRPTVELLSRVPLFETLSKTQLGRIAALAEDTTYNAGRVIVKRDHPGRAFYVIVDGQAKVVKGKITSARAEAMLGPGEFFGELALLDGEPRAASVVAASRLETIRIDRSAFRRVLRTDPEIAIKLLEGMARRTRKILASPPP